MPRLVIPHGWYRIGPYDTIIEGDEFPDGEGGWALCYSSIGCTPDGAFGEDPVIRKCIPAPVTEPDREWLNPWD